MSTPILNAVVLQKSMNMAQVLGFFFFFFLKKRTQTFFFLNLTSCISCLCVALHSTTEVQQLSQSPHNKNVLVSNPQAGWSLCL